MKDFSKNQTIFFIVGGLIMAFVIGYYMFKTFQTNEPFVLEDALQISEEEKTNAIEEQEMEEAEELEQIIVHIAGSVKQEGVIKTKEGARIADIIELAGGLKENSDISNMNLAYKVEDGQKIYIPYQGENLNEAEEITQNMQTIQKEKKEELVNINTATKTELETLNGIGPATAAKIIEYREAKGKFQKIEDIKNVTGIGEAKFQAIKERICVK